MNVKKRNILFWSAIAAALLLFVVGVAADENEATIAAKREMCAGMGEFARSAMRARQAGIDLSTMLEIHGQSELRNAIRTVIIAAYKRPRYSTESKQQHEVGEFSTLMHLGCLEAAGTE